MAWKHALPAAAALALALTASEALATELTHHMVNPAFGGNPLNGSWMLSNAQAQDNNKDPSTTSSSSSLDNMTSSLNSTILSILSPRGSPPSCWGTRACHGHHHGGRLHHQRPGQHNQAVGDRDPDLHRPEDHHRDSAVAARGTT